MTHVAPIANPATKVAQRRQRAIIEYLRSMVVGQEDRGERFHSVFLDHRHGYVGDIALGQGGTGSLTLRMRDLFAQALAVRANAVIIAHNHPSGHCRPSQFDIDSTLRLKEVGLALDIELLDHLIFTQDAAYSMRAGGIL